MKIFSSELKELKKFGFMFENPVGGGAYVRSDADKAW